MKKDLTKYLLLSLVLLLAFSALAVAQEENGTDDTDEGNETADDLENETAGELEQFSSNWGAQMRLLQLEKSIARNIYWGEEIIEKIKAINESTDTSELEAILDEMRLLREEVAALRDGNLSGNDSAQAFVDLKQDAISLSKEFRDLARSMVSAKDLGGIKKSLGQRGKEELNQLREQIRATRNQYNNETIAQILEDAGVNDTGLLGAISDDNLTKKQVAAMLKAAVSGTDSMLRTNLAMALRENQAKRNVYKTAIEEKVMQSQAERTQERLQARLELLGDNASLKIRQRIQDRIEKSTQQQERLQEKEVDRETRQEEKTVREQERTENQGNGSSGNGKGNGKVTEMPEGVDD